MGRWWFVLARILLDMAFIPITVILAYGAKFKVGWVFHYVLDIPFGDVYGFAQVEPYLSNLGIITLIWMVCYMLMGAYRPFLGTMAEVDEWIVVFKGTSMAVICLMAFTFLDKSFPGSRFVMGYLWLFGILTSGITRYFLFRIEMLWLRQSKQLQTAMVLGVNNRSLELVERLVTMPILGFRYIGSIDQEPIQNLPYIIQNQYHHLGLLTDWLRHLQTHQPDVIFIVDLPIMDWTPIRNWCGDHGITCYVSSAVEEDISVSTKATTLDDIPLIQYSPPSPPLVKIWLKAIIDWVLALVILLLISPVMIIIATLIKLVSPSGPVLFSQERVGKDGILFRMIKFRTMIPNAEQLTGPIMVDIKNETRYIRFGRFLRRTSLDELPQLLNVLKGEMSLVGPRPERPHFVAEFSKTIPSFNQRHQVKGGITGWAQINGRSQLTHHPAQKLRYDLYYINHWGFALDFKIILKTIEWVVFSREAY